MSEHLDGREALIARVDVDLVVSREGIRIGTSGTDRTEDRGSHAPWGALPDGGKRVPVRMQSQTLWSAFRAEEALEQLSRLIRQYAVAELDPVVETPILGDVVERPGRTCFGVGCAIDDSIDA